jgi:hypothetical protein
MVLVGVLRVIHDEARLEPRFGAQPGRGSFITDPTPIERQRTLPTGGFAGHVLVALHIKIRIKALALRQPPAQGERLIPNGPARNPPCGAVLYRLADTACVTFGRPARGECRRDWGGPLSAKAFRAVLFVDS